MSSGSRGGEKRAKWEAGERPGGCAQTRITLIIHAVREILLRERRGATRGNCQEEDSEVERDRGRGHRKREYVCKRCETISPRIHSSIERKLISIIFIALFLLSNESFKYIFFKENAKVLLAPASKTVNVFMFS